MFRSAKARRHVSTRPAHERVRRRPLALFVYRALTDALGKGATLVLTLLAAHALSRDGFGVFSLGSTIGWMAAVASDAGIQMHLARLVSRYPHDAARIWSVWMRIRCWTSLVAVAAVALATPLAGVRTSAGTAIVIFALYYAVTGLVELTFYFFRGLSRSDVESAVTVWLRLGTLVCGGLALWLVPQPAALAAALLLPACVTLAYCFARARQMGLEAARPAGPGTGAAPARPPGPRPSTRVMAQLSSDVLPIGAGIVLSALYFRVDVLLIGRWMGTEPVALYNAVFRVVEALRLVPAAALAVALPSLCRATSLRPLVLLAAALSASAAIGAGGLAAGAGWLIPLLYGELYAPAVPAFRILLLAFPLMALNYALTHQLIGWDRHGAFAGICGLALVFNVALNSRLIPALSIDGAAWTTVATEVVVTIGCGTALWLERSQRRARLAQPSRVVVSA